MNRQSLETLRVLDLSQVYAGPLAGRMLADMGAEVIRIESAVRSTRGGAKTQPGATYPNGDHGERPYNRSAYYNELNRGKLAVSLDLSRHQGQDIFKQLAKISDIVLENFTPRVMTNFGLEYSVLRQIKPDIIMVSISAYGQTGPYRDYVSFGRGIEAMAGLSDITGYQDGSPLGPGTAYADATGGLHAVFAVMVALRHRKRTGKGQHIDVSLNESLIALLGEHVLDYSMNHRRLKREGNRDRPGAIQGCYRCCGEDDWIAIAIESVHELEALCNVIGHEVHGHDTIWNRFMRWQTNQQELDESIEVWTSQRNSKEAMINLQNAGIRAGAVLNAAQLNKNPHLSARGFFHKITHPEAGTFPQSGIPWKMSQTPHTIFRPAPRFAEHNDYVFGELLGMSPEQIAQLETAGTTAKVPVR